MPFDGSGNYVPPGADFPAVAGTTISSTHFNNVINDIATAISACLTRDNQGKPSANQNWNGKDLSNVASLTASSATITSITAGGLTLVGNAAFSGGIVSIASLTLGAALGTVYGGTGVDGSAAANGKLLIGNGAGYSLATITPGAGISVTNGAGTITIAATGGGGAGTTSFPLTIDNSGTGAASGSTFNGSAARTLSHNSIGAQPLVPRINAVNASSGAVNNDASLFDVCIITGDAAISIGLGSNASQGLGIVFRIKDNGTARAISWNAAYRAIGLTLPTTTVVSKILYVGCIWNATDSKWDVVSTAQEA